MMGPPYDQSFVQLFLPLIQNEAITGTFLLRTEEERKLYAEFVEQASAVNSTNM